MIPRLLRHDHPTTVGAGLVVGVAALASLVAWALLAILERTIRRPCRTWTVIGVAALIVSLGAPLSGHGVIGGDRAVLAGLHLLVATTLIMVLGPTVSRPDTRAQEDRLEQVHHW